MIAYIRGDKSLTLFIKGKPISCYPSSEDYNKIEELILNGATEDELLSLISIKEALKHFIGDSKVISFDGHNIYYKTEKLESNSLTERILEMMSNKMPLTYLVNFLENVMENPYERNREDLFTFLLRANLPITEDGCFLAYKYVTDDYYDPRTGNTVYYGIGSTPAIPWDEADVDPNRTCSSGLHFCGMGYLNGSIPLNRRLIVLKINPKDVASFPVDYDSHKGRCVKCYVLSEITTDRGNIKEETRIERTHENTKKAQNNNNILSEVSEILGGSDPIKVTSMDSKAKALFQSMRNINGAFHNNYVDKVINQNEWLYKYIMDKTTFIDFVGESVPLTMRVRCIEDGITSWPTCPNCGKKVSYGKNRFNKFCSPNCASEYSKK